MLHMLLDTGNWWVCVFPPVSVCVPSPMCPWRTSSQEAAQRAGEPLLSRLWKCELQRPERWVSPSDRHVVRMQRTDHEPVIVQILISCSCVVWTNRDAAHQTLRLCWLLSTTWTLFFYHCLCFQLHIFLDREDYKIIYVESVYINFNLICMCLYIFCPLYL